MSESTTWLNSPPIGPSRSGQFDGYYIHIFENMAKVGDINLNWQVSVTGLKYNLRF